MVEPFISELQKVAGEVLSGKVDLECGDALAAIVTAVVTTYRDIRAGNNKYIQRACLGIAVLAYFVYSKVDKP